MKKERPVMASTMQIFVSHSHHDASFCHNLVQALRSAGADVWYDEHNLGSGQLMEVVQRELDRRPVFIVILSPSAFAALAEFERELIIERTKAAMAAARARGRNGARPYKMTAAKLRLTMASMGQKEIKVGELCAELGITRQTLYRHVGPDGSLRSDGKKLLGSGKPATVKSS